MFVLISLVTQGAFESAGERKFKRRERGEEEGQLSCALDAASETGAWGLRSGGCLDTKGSQPALRLGTFLNACVEHSERIVLWPKSFFP